MSPSFNRINLRVFLVFVLLTFACSIPTVAHADIVSNLLTWYKFDEGSGTTALDSSGNGYNMVAYGSYPTYVAGKLGGQTALSFNGSGDSLQASPSPANFSDGEVTVAAWVNYSGTGGGDYTIIGSNDYNAMRFYINASNKLCFDETDDVTMDCSTASVPTGSWVHVAGSYDNSFGGRIFFYINGTSDGPYIYNLGGYLVASLRIGVNGRSSNFYFNGVIDDVRLYHRVLSSSDITELYNYDGFSVHMHFGKALLKHAHIN